MAFSTSTLSLLLLGLGVSCTRSTDPAYLGTQQFLAQQPSRQQQPLIVQLQQAVKALQPQASLLSLSSQPSVVEPQVLATTAQPSLLAQVYAALPAALQPSQPAQPPQQPNLEQSSSLGTLLQASAQPDLMQAQLPQMPQLPQQQPASLQQLQQELQQLPQLPQMPQMPQLTQQQPASLQQQLPQMPQLTQQQLASLQQQQQPPQMPQLTQQLPASLLAAGMGQTQQASSLAQMPLMQNFMASVPMQEVVDLVQTVQTLQTKTQGLEKQLFEAHAHEQQLNDIAQKAAYSSSTIDQSARKLASLAQASVTQAQKSVGEEKAAMENMKTRLTQIEKEKNDLSHDKEELLKQLSDSHLTLKHIQDREVQERLRAETSQALSADFSQNHPAQLQPDLERDIHNAFVSQPLPSSPSSQKLARLTSTLQELSRDANSYGTNVQSAQETDLATASLTGGVSGANGLQATPQTLIEQLQSQSGLNSAESSFRQDLR